MAIKKQILIIPGDKIGPEVIFWGKAVLEQIATVSNFTFDEALMGHAAIEAFRVKFKYLTNSRI